MPLFLKQLVVTLILFVDILSLIFSFASPRRDAFLVMLGVWAISALVIIALFAVKVPLKNRDNLS